MKIARGYLKNVLNLLSSRGLNDIRILQRLASMLRDVQYLFIIGDFIDCSTTHTSCEERQAKVIKNINSSIYETNAKIP